MKSVQCICTWREFATITLPTLAVLTGMAVSLKVAGGAGWLPARPVAMEADMTVLDHQAMATHQAPAADIVVAGDSTCLAGVDAPSLSGELPGKPRVLSLALFIWMDLGIYAQAVADFATAHPNQLHTVVLLVSPMKLASTATGAGGEELWRRAQPSELAKPEAANGGAPWDWLGAGLLRRHLLSHCLATPLHGSGAEFFGFSSEIDRYMTEHEGSLLTFGTSVVPRSATRAAWKLAPELETDTRAFRNKMPPGIRLFVGLTPGPESTATPGPWRSELLKNWNVWLQADALLTNLPPTLPDILFSGGGHLNANGQRVFTAALARELGPLLQDR